MAIVHSELENRFAYHPATPDTARTYAHMRNQFLMMAEYIVNYTPPGRDQSLALTELQSAMHWANSAIAMETPVDSDPKRVRT